MRLGRVGSGIDAGSAPVTTVCGRGGQLLADLKGVEIDIRRRTALWAGAGLTAGEYTAATAVHGLATGVGDTGSVGIGGITLSGGIGYLVRKHGLTIDNLLAADVVTADGELCRADPRQRPDLFWAIRGGGGNFGVVTRFHYRLHEVDIVIGGTLVFPATPQTLTRYLAEALAAPEELTSVVTVLPAGHGRLVMRATLVYAGDLRAGERAVAPFQRLAEPITDTVGRRRYRDVLASADGEHRTWAHRTMFLDAVDVDAAGALLAALHESDSPMPLAQLRVLGGAMARIAADATAFAHRTAPLLANVAALHELPVQEDWVGRVAEMLGPRGDAAVGFLGDEGRAGVREAYPGRTWDRLTEVKRRYDPTNLFRHNQNVPPADR